MSVRPDSLVGTRLPESVCARCAHAGGLLGWLEEALPPLPFAMCFSAAEERPGGILALPNGFLKTLVAKRYGDELARYAESAGFERIEIVLDPTLFASTADEHAPAERRGRRPPPMREQPSGLTTRLVRGARLLATLSARRRQDASSSTTCAAGSRSRRVRRVRAGRTRRWCSPGLLAIWGDGPRTEPIVECGLRRLSTVLGLAWGGRTAIPAPNSDRAAQDDDVPRDGRRMRTVGGSGCSRCSTRSRRAGSGRRRRSTAEYAPSSRAPRGR